MKNTFWKHPFVAMWCFCWKQYTITYKSSHNGTFQLEKQNAAFNVTDAKEGEILTGQISIKTLENRKCKWVLGKDATWRCCNLPSLSRQKFKLDDLSASGAASLLTGQKAAAPIGGVGSIHQTYKGMCFLILWFHFGEFTLCILHS